MIFKVPVRLLSVCVFIFLVSGLFAQESAEIDSLKKILRSTTEGETVDLMNQLAEAHAGKEWDKSQRYANLALDLATSLQDQYGQAVAHTNLALYYIQQANYREALDHATLALNTFESLSDDYQIAVTLRTIGRTYSLLNQSDQSLDYFLRSLMIFEDIEKEEEVAETVLMIGDVFSQWGQTEKALRFFERSLSIHEALGDHKGVLLSENKLAQSLMTLRRFDEAKEHLERGVEIAEKNDAYKLLANLYTSLGELHYHQLQLAAAQNYFLEALEMKRIIGDPGDIAVALSDVARVYQESGETDRAISYYEEGQQLAESAGQNAISAEIYLQMGELYMQEADQTKAIEAFLAGLNIAQKIQDYLTIERADHLLTAAYSRFGQADKALVYQQNLQLTRDEINRQQSNRRVAELEIRYELDKRDRELDELKGEAFIKEIEYQRTFTVMWVIFGFSSAILILILAFVFYRARFIRRTEQEKMEQALRIKADFTAMLVHDLKSPLTSVFGFAELLKMGEKPYDRIKEIATTIRKTSQKMLQLVNEMLDLSKFEAGKMVLNKTNTPLKPIIRTSIEMLSPVADQNETEVSFAGVDGLPSCYCDPLKIEQVITNFIGNAIEHTPKGTKIKVALQEIKKNGEPFLYFSVTDDGPGVDKDQQDKIFDKYAQLSSRKTAKGLGSGLGLAVSQMTIEQHGGQVGYKDAEPVGSIFYFTLPIKNQEIPKVQPSKSVSAQA
ncbi:MAG: tetratricopeptide repeat-containing sensor histidine kinase [Candidatus Marinimicrobia bacterium]|nr:tetratricopeptide repeat-containing sensor histidine kinase [Candidatus Neomarinimicrobiota bacterium]